MPEANLAMFTQNRASSSRLRESGSDSGHASCMKSHACSRVATVLLLESRDVSVGAARASGTIRFLDVWPSVPVVLMEASLERCLLFAPRFFRSYACLGVQAALMPTQRSDL